MAYLPFKIVRRDADTTPAADGAASELVTNLHGRLKVSATPAAYDLVTGTLGAVAATVSADVTRASNAIIAVTGGTFAGLNFTFEGSVDNGTSWVGVQAVRTNANTIETTSGVIAAAPAYAWEVSVNGLTNVRVRATAWTSGSANVTISRAPYATEPIPAIQTHAVTQSGVWHLSASTSATGTSIFRDIALSNADVTVKSSAARLYNYYLYNPNTSDVWVHFYNALIANVTVGTTTPTWSVFVPAGGTAEREFTIPISFGTGIAAAATTTLTGGTAPASAVVAEVGFI